MSIVNLSFSVCRSASKERKAACPTTYSVFLFHFIPIVISIYPDKLSVHKCGFDPSGDARSRSEIRFDPVSILFIIPDPEVTFSFPWAVPTNNIDPFGSWSMVALLFILTIGSLYEWKRGALDRE